MSLHFSTSNQNGKSINHYHFKIFDFYVIAGRETAYTLMLRTLYPCITLPQAQLVEHWFEGHRQV